MQSKNPFRASTPLAAALIVLSLAAPARATVQLGLHMDFVLKNGTTVRVFPAAEDADMQTLRPRWSSAPARDAALDDSSCKALEEEYKQRTGKREKTKAAARTQSAPLATSSYPAWLNSVPAMKAVISFGPPSAAKPSGWYYLPTEPRLTFKDGKPEATFLSFVTDEETGADAAEGGLFHLMVGYGLTRAEQDELAGLLGAAVPGAQLKGMVELTPAAKGDNFIVTSGTLSADQFAPSGVLTSGRAPTYPGGKAALAGRLSDLGAQLLFATFEKPTSDLSVTFAYDYVAKTRALTAEITINLDRIRRVTECNLKLQSTKRSSGIGFVFPFAFWSTSNVDRVSRKEVEEGYEALLNTGAVHIAIDQNLPDVEVAHLEESLMKMALEAFVDMQRTFAVSQQDEGDPKAGQENGKGEAAEKSDRPQADDYEVYQVRRKNQRMSGQISMSFSKSIAVYRTHAMTGNLGAELKRFGPDVFSKVILNDPFFKRGRITVDLDVDALELFKARMVNNASIEVVVPFASGRDFRENEIFTAPKVESGAITRTFTFAAADDKPRDEACPFKYIASWSLRGGGRWPPQPEPRCSREMKVTLSPPIEVRDIEVEADLEELERLGLRAADVRLRYQRYGKEAIDIVKFRLGKPEPFQQVRLFVDRADERTPVDYSVVFTHKDKGALPPTPWQRLESGFVYTSVSGLPRGAQETLAAVVGEIKGLLEATK
jgi:hypothetical protein